MKRKFPEELPDALVGKVLGNLSQKDVCATRPACHSFRGAKPQWSKLTLRSSHDLHVAKAAATSVSSCLREMTIHNGIHSVPNVAVFSNLQKLRLERCSVMPFMPALAQLQHLVSLKLENCYTTTEGIFHLKGLHLKHLYLSRCPFDDQGLCYIAQITTLESLELALSHHCTDEGIAMLLALVNLQHLELDYFYKLTDASAAYIGQLPRLKSLKMLVPQFTDDGLAHLSARLETLWLCISSNITDAGLAHLGKLSNLTDLSLSHNRLVTGAGIKHLASLSKLQHLDLYSCPIADDGCVHLAALCELETLKIGGTKVTDAGLVHVATLSKLRELNLNLTTVSDQGVAHLAALTELEKLSLCKCYNFSDNGLLPFVLHNKLREIDYTARMCSWPTKRRLLLANK